MLAWRTLQLHPSKQSLLQEPSRALVEYVVGRFDPDPDAGDACSHPGLTTHHLSMGSV